MVAHRSRPAIRNLLRASSRRCSSISSKRAGLIRKNAVVNLGIWSTVTVLANEQSDRRQGLAVRREVDAAS